MSESWSVPANWDWDIDKAIEDFTGEAGIRKDMLARAIGLDPASLSISHLQDPKKSRYLYQRLPTALRHDRLAGIAEALALDFTRWMLLKRLASRVLAINSGYQIEPEKLIPQTEEATEIGFAGVHLFDAGNWREAVSLLTPAWTHLSGITPEPDTTTFLAALRVVTQLAGWYSFQGRAQEIVADVQSVSQRLRNYGGRDPEVILSIFLFHKAAGIVLRHAGWHPELVIDRLKVAERIGAERELNPLWCIAPIRDQAKPYVLWGLSDDEDLRKYFAAARDVLDRAEQLAGGSEPYIEGRTEWLHTRLTRIECLVAMGFGDEALRVASDTFQRPWIEDVPATHTDRQLDARLTFIEIAIRIAQRDFDAAARLAREYRKHGAQNLLAGRDQRALDLEKHASAGDASEISRTLVR